MNDVAVVGMGCRLPGGINSPDELWQMILEKRDASSEIPSTRWEPWKRRDVRNSEELEKVPKRGYFLDHLEAFDPAFFGISPKEAEQMDPQQRIALEVVWEALEQAGLSAKSLSGSDTGVFIGVNSDDYSRLLLEDLPRLEPWMGIGTAYCGVPNRVSYQLNLMGPSLAVDAACASSLVSIHLGRQAILQGECKVAIVGGVNALCSPGMTIVLDKAGATSNDGTCRSFDDTAHGYGRGEGAAIIVLKRMDDAINDRDNILAIVKGSAVAQDGRTNGIMAPNSTAQEVAARKALRAAEVDPSTVSYIEAHATSTPLGDKTEIAALSKVYGDSRRPENPCHIGSVKPNVGHLEAGAGAVGFIKSVMAIRNGLLPPQANLEQLNSNIDWKSAGVQVVQDVQEWPKLGTPRRAGVCSYGYGGTVSHVIIEQYKSPQINGLPKQSVGAQVLLLSSPHESRLRGEAEKLSLWIGNVGNQHTLASTATTLATRREHHSYRAGLVVEDCHDATKRLKAVGNHVDTDWVTQSRVLTKGTRKDVTFVFSGHGAQWADMGKELLNNRVFYDTVASLESIVEAEGGFSALESLRQGDFDFTDRIQILTYVLQVGLIAVLRSKGLQPNAVIGHSVGEIAAAVCAGCLTPREGALIVTKRAKLYRSMMGAGAMAAIFKPSEQLKEELKSRTDIVVAIHSSPSTCVLSGDKISLETLIEELKNKGVKSIRVKTDVSFHHPSLSVLTEPLTRELDGLLAPQLPKIKCYSTSQDDPHSLQLRDIDYWCRNMVQPVNLSSAVASAASDGLRLFLEVSSHPIVSHSVQEVLMHSGIVDFGVYHTMSRQQRAEKTILFSLANLHCQGCEIDWTSSMNGSWAPDVPLVGWNHQSIWRKVETGPLGTATTHHVDHHVLLGSRVAVADEDLVTYATILQENTKPFPGNHPVHGSEIIPAAVLINTFLFGTGARQLFDIHLRVPITTNKPRDIQFVVRSDHAKICSRLIRTDIGNNQDGGSWQTHTSGSWSSADATKLTLLSKVNIGLKKTEISTRLENTFSIDYLSKVGVTSMGFPWVVLEHYGNQQEMIALVDVAPDLDTGSSLPWNPRSWAPILDSATSVGSTLFSSKPRLRMPSFVDRISLLTSKDPPKSCYIYVQVAMDVPPAVDISICGKDGTVLMLIKGMQFSEIEGGFRPNAGLEGLVHQVAWPPASYKENPLPINHLVLISRDPCWAERYYERVPPTVLKTIVLNSVEELSNHQQTFETGTAIVYLPMFDVPVDSVAATSSHHAMDLLSITKLAVKSSLAPKIFVLTNGVLLGQAAALGQSALHGLSRIIASEHPEVWGGLIDLDSPTIPLDVMKYVQGEDVICVSDGIPRIAHLRNLTRERLRPSPPVAQSFSPGGTFLITGGLGDLGLATAEYLVEQGARRIILISRRSLPARSNWDRILAESSPIAPVIQKLLRLEAFGATIRTLQFDMASELNPQKLAQAIESLDLPPVIGVIHAAGVIENELVLCTTKEGFNRVVAPKITGAILLHRLFEPKALDFMIFFSSCGQLFGFPGQASYATGNSFLDALATHRRNQGDNTVSMQWSSWRGMGMSTSSDFIDAELASKGITDITRDEAFQALSEVLRYDVPQAAVLRSLPIDENEPLPSKLLSDIVERKSPTLSASHGPPPPHVPKNGIPSSPEERRAYLELVIRDSVSQVLHMTGSGEVDPKAALSDLGLDSVLTVSLRRVLQKALGINVPPTLTWTCPTVMDMAVWFESKV